MLRSGGNVAVLGVEEDGELLLEGESGLREGLRERLWERERERLAILVAEGWTPEGGHWALGAGQFLVTDRTAAGPWCMSGAVAGLVEADDGRHSRRGSAGKVEVES